MANKTREIPLIQRKVIENFSGLFFSANAYNAPKWLRIKHGMLYLEIIWRSLTSWMDVVQSADTLQILFRGQP